ncbi:hypothetical protein IFM89_010851 [Coptis chinensis]|uniref:Uncharacterized protein n=1 Tax=Coptis chinensis TaxID=261450 RepID=A0A835I1A3_9MAGN|nr:hypothetical protein IFM89_010851 [Coptis chinensis]
MSVSTKPFLHSSSLPKPSTLFLKTPTKNFLTFSYSSDQQLLHSLTQNNGKTTSLPSVRTYESDLCRLSIVGDVSFEQALTAAAADGGEAADEHIKADMDTMVVETVFPGSADERTTVSTRLFLPTREVKEKARKLRSTLPKDMLSSMTSTNILAMTFRQVVLQRIWSFELQLLSAGAERNMEDLENPREVPAIFTISSSDERVLSVLAEAVCMYALESTEMDFGEGTIGTASNSFLGWFQKPRRIASKDFSVIIYKMSEDELVKSAKMFSQNFEINFFSTPTEVKRKYRRWMPSTYSKLGKIGGPEFITWATEYLPAYRLQVDVNKLKNVKFEGWKNAAENRWEVLLTHSQMVELADTLDMYYEDLYTLPNKQLSCGVVADISKLSKNKRSTSLWKKLIPTLVGGLFVVSISILAQFYRSRLYEARRSRSELFTEQSSKTECYQHQKLEESEVHNRNLFCFKKRNLIRFT